MSIAGGSKPFHTLLALALLLAAFPASAQIALDSSGLGQCFSCSSTSWAQTIGAGSHMILVVGVTTNGPAGATSVTFGSQPLTRQILSEGPGVTSELWTLVAPPAGSDTVTVQLPAIVDALVSGVGELVPRCGPSVAHA